MRIHKKKTFILKKGSGKYQSEKLRKCHKSSEDGGPLLTDDTTLG